MVEVETALCHDALDGFDAKVKEGSKASRTGDDIVARDDQCSEKVIHRIVAQLRHRDLCSGNNLLSWH